jgi:hypothetical protein
MLATFVKKKQQNNTYLPVTEKMKIKEQARN